MREQDIEVEATKLAGRIIFTINASIISLGVLHLLTLLKIINISPLWFGIPCCAIMILKPIKTLKVYWQSCLRGVSMSTILNEQINKLGKE